MGNGLGDPLINAVYLGIKTGITTCFNKKLFGSALILIYTGIDVMAWLDMPESQQSSTRKDFIQWVEKYFDSSFTQQVHGEELYSARCAVVHTYGIESGLTRSGTSRMIGYIVEGPPIVYNTTSNPDLVILELGHLKEQFFNAIDNFLMRAFADTKKGALIDQRARNLLNNIPYLS